METKPVFEGRPGADRVFRVLLSVLAAAMLLIGVVTQDLRSGAVGVLVVAFLLRETFELGERGRQAALVVMVAAAAVWAVEAFA